MAYFQRRRNNQVAVYFWNKDTGKPQQVSREETAELDVLSDDEVRAWLIKWEAANGRSRIRSRRRSLLKDDELSKLIEAHLAEHAALYAPSEGTMAEYRYHFETYITPYFVRDKGAKDLKTWHTLTPSFGAYLIQEKKLSPGSVRKICQTLQRFGGFLVDQGLISHPWRVRSPRSKGKRTTPLSHRLGPEDALALADSLARAGHPLWALEMLLSYFGSLRPEEVYALNKEDFITGQAARSRARTWGRFQKHGLGSGLSVLIEKTHIGKEPSTLTKTHYARGVVNIWDSAAAVAIAALLRELPDGRLFGGTRAQINYQYRKIAKPTVNLNAQDRRRASANYLGKEVGVDPILLQDHLRHSEIETTMLYTRDPMDRNKDSGNQDFDDVG
jgi:integrase